MRIHILPASAAGTPGHPLTGFVIDGRLAVDAGPLGWCGPVEEQADVSDLLLTHSHVDHVAGLPVFLDNVYMLRDRPPAVYALPETLQVVQSDIFNNRLMPDFIEFSRRMPPFLTLHPITPDRPFAVGPYTVTPIPLTHTIPIVGYLIDDRTSAVAVLTDTAPVPEVVAAVANWPRLRAVFLECSFPNSMAQLARTTCHLTTADFLTAAARFPPAVRVVAIHIKPGHHADVLTELAAGGLPNVSVGDGGSVIEV